MSVDGADPLAWVARRRLDGLLLAGTDLAAPHEVVGRLTAMQAQDHPRGRWSIAQRTLAPSAATVDAAFNDGEILRTHLLRPTWHYVTPGNLRWLIKISGPRVDRAISSKYRQLELDPPTLRRAVDVIGASTADGPKTRDELATALNNQRISTAGERITFVLMHAELAGVICSGPMRRRQHTYAAFAQRVPPGPSLDADDALGELAWRYFSTRGPATLADFSWWSGLGTREGGRALDAVKGRLGSVIVDNETYWLSEPGRQLFSPGHVALVAFYDEVMLSYRHPRDALRRPGAGPVQPDRNGGLQHPILLDGRIVGQWRRKPGADGPIETRVAHRLSRGEQAALDAAISQFRRFAAS